MTADTSGTAARTENHGPDPLPGDLSMTRTLWPMLLASAVGLLPFTVFSTYLVPVAADAGSSVAAMGGLRGLGGLAALAVGSVLAPLIDRIPRSRAAAGGLVVLGAASALGANGGFALMIVFCLLVGASTAVLNPALTAAAADRFGSGGAAARAATLVTATTSMTAMLAAPLIALPALLWGWEGNLLAVAFLALALAALIMLRAGKDASTEEAPRPRPLGWSASFRTLAAVRGAVPLLIVSFLRTAVFMGALAYLAAYYDDRFRLGPEMFALVWTLSGASFFVSNLLTGRFTNAAAPRMTTERLLFLGLLSILASATGLWFTTALPLALALTALHAAGHAVVAACAVSLLVRRCGSLRGTALSLNSAGQSLGVFAGAAVGGVGLGVAGYPGVAVAFGVLVVVALVAAAPVLKGAPAGGAEPAAGPPD